MPAFRSTLLLALLAGQAAAFFVADKPVKALGPLQSAYNRNYDSAGYEGGMRRYNDFDRSNYGNSYNRGYNEYDRGMGGQFGVGGNYGMGGNYGTSGNHGMGSNYGSSYGTPYGGNDGGYGYGQYGGMQSRSKFGDWLNGSSNYIPTSADRSYVMDRGYETGGRYGGNMYYNPDRYSNSRYGNMGSNDRYNNRDMYSSGRFNSGDRYNTRGGYGSGGYGSGGYGGRNSYDRYSPVSYNRGGSYDRDNRSVNGGYNRNYRDNRSLTNEYSRTYRSASDSHRQDYPNYGMGAMEDQFGYKKWWDSN